MYISFLRLEWDLNPRMTVLQTVALGHLAIQPIACCGEIIPIPPVQVKHIPHFSLQKSKSHGIKLTPWL